MVLLQVVWWFKNSKDINRNEFGGKNFICFAGVIEINFKFVGVNGLEGDTHASGDAPDPPNGQIRDRLYDMDDMLKINKYFVSLTYNLLY